MNDLFPIHVGRQYIVFVGYFRKSDSCCYYSVYSVTVQAEESSLRFSVIAFLVFNHLI